MPVSCAARGCPNRCNVSTRAKGITFHRFPKDLLMRKKWEVALRRDKFTATKACRLCSDHFTAEDFDRTGQTVRIRDGSVPSVFSFPARLHRPVKTRTSQRSREVQESTSCPQPVQETDSTDSDHLYALPSSPSDLTARLNQVLARVECLEREKRNAKDRERRAKNRMFCLLEYLEEKKLLNEEMRERLDSNLEKQTTPDELGLDVPPTLSDNMQLFDEDSES